MIDHTAILSGALIDYNDWVVKQNNAIVGAPGELRGIFYNKLVTRLKDRYTTYDLRAAIKPDHLIMSFTTSGYIANLCFSKERSYTSSSRNEILNGLERALLDIDVTDYQDKLSYELSRTILDLKKSLNYGRQQTTR